MGYIPHGARNIMIIFIGIIMLFFSISQVIGQQKNTLRENAVASGVQTATNLGEGRDITVNGLQQSYGYASGVDVSFLVGEEGNLTPVYIFDDVQKISDLSSLLTVDLEAFVAQSEQRVDALNIYKNEIMSQQLWVKQRLDSMTRQLNDLTTAYNNSQNKQNDLQNKVFASLDSKLPFEAEDALHQFLKTKSITGDLYTRTKIADILHDKYQTALELLNNKLDFITANRDALIQGVKVVDLTDPTIKLILTKEEWQNTVR